MFFFFNTHMSFYDRLTFLCSQRNERLSNVLKNLQISTGNMARWKDENVNISSETLQKLADFFDVSVDYLLGRTDTPKPPTVELPDLYFNLAKEAQDLGLDEEDIEQILAIYRKHSKEKDD